MKKFKNCWLVISMMMASFLILSVAPLAAQSYRYMDEAGNIIFADSIGEVPSRYRNQLPGYKPPVAVVPDKKGKKKSTKVKPTPRPTKTPRPPKIKKQRGPKLQRYNAPSSEQGVNPPLPEVPVASAQPTAFSVPVESADALPTIAPMIDFNSVMSEAAAGTK